MLHTSLTGATSANQAVIGFSGATEVFRLNNATPLASSLEILLDYSLNPGSGAGDMFLYVRNSSFAQTPGSNIILYSQFGVPPGSAATNDGFEEWAVLRGSTNAVPEPSTIAVAFAGFAALGFNGLRRLRRKPSVV
jgi:hypothetical protein